MCLWMSLGDIGNFCVLWGKFLAMVLIHLQWEEFVCLCYLAMGH